MIVPLAPHPDRINNTQPLQGRLRHTTAIRILIPTITAIRTTGGDRHSPSSGVRGTIMAARTMGADTMAGRITAADTMAAMRAVDTADNVELELELQTNVAAARRADRSPGKQAGEVDQIQLVREIVHASLHPKNGFFVLPELHACAEV